MENIKISYEREGRKYTVELPEDVVASDFVEELYNFAIYAAQYHPDSIKESIKQLNIEE